MTQITDPAILSQLNTGGQVTDPAILARLNEPERGVADRVIGGVGALGSGVLEGLAHTVGLPGDVIQSILGTPRQPRDLPTTQDVKDFSSRMATKAGKALGFEGDLGQVYQPQNQLERYVSKGAEGVTSTVGPGGPMKLLAAMGLASGLGGEAGSQFFGDAENKDHFGHNVGTAAPEAAMGAAAINPKLAASLLTYTLPSAILPPALEKLLMGVKTGFAGKGGTTGLALAIARSLAQQDQGK